MKGLIGLLILVLVISLACAAAGAEEEGLIKRMFRKSEEKAAEADDVTAEPEKSPFEDLTKQEMIGRIYELLDYRPEVLNFVPAIHAIANEDGSVTYLYKSESGIGVDLEDLDRETLQNLIIRISSESNRLNTEQVMRQLDQARRAQRAAVPIPQPPTVHTPPRIPVIPRQPVTPPAANQTPQPPRN